MALTAEQLEEQALAAKRLKTDAGEREAHSLKDLVELNDYLANQQAASSTVLPVRLAKIRNGGATVCRE